MEVHLGGHLAFYDRQKRSRFEVHVEGEVQLLDLIRELGVPEAEIAIAAVNRSLVAPATAVVRDADRLDLYPPMSGGAPAAFPARAGRAAGRAARRRCRNRGGPAQSAGWTCCRSTRSTSSSC
jgi:sulfur carrier protein ThiS